MVHDIWGVTGMTNLDEAQAEVFVADAPAVTITPLAGLRSVQTIPAIKALRDTGLLGLLESKRLVERMVVEGAADTGMGRYAEALSEPGAADLAAQAERALATAGVALLVDGMPLAEWMDRTDRPFAVA